MLLVFYLVQAGLFVHFVIMGKSRRS
jgi:hypothetical protein